VSDHVRRYLIEQGGERCSRCGWHERHPITGRVPLEIDHLDGNYANNSLSNVRLLCPNCHALTPTYRALNKGNGRPWAMVRRQA
jgi:RNase P subunit RPR2